MLIQQPQDTRVVTIVVVYSAFSHLRHILNRIVHTLYLYTHLMMNDDTVHAIVYYDDDVYMKSDLL